MDRLDQVTVSHADKGELSREVQKLNKHSTTHDLQLCALPEPESKFSELCSTHGRHSTELKKSKTPPWFEHGTARSAIVCSTTELWSHAFQVRRVKPYARAPSVVPGRSIIIQANEDLPPRSI